MIGAGSLRVRAAALAAALAAGAAFLAAGAWIPLKAEVAQLLLNRAWAAADAGRAAMKPWPWADTRPMARLHLPGGGEPLIVLAGASGRNLAFGPTHVGGTALPGAQGVSIIAGHRDTHFRGLQHVRVGDVIDIDVPGEGSLRYDVTAVDIVDAGSAALRHDAETPSLALVTCYPFDAAVPGGPLRYVVTAKLRPGIAASRETDVTAIRGTDTMAMHVPGERITARPTR